MKINEIQVLESYYQTENEHWNKYAFDMICEVIEQGQFQNPEQPLQIFSTAIDIFTEHYESPLRAVQLFIDALDKEKLTESQKYFICNWVCKYIANSEFEKADLTKIRELMSSQKAKLKAASQPKDSLVKDIRSTLKEMMQKELEQLPETLKELEPAQRLNILCKLMPFVLPKVESIHCEKDEPVSSGFRFSDILGHLP